MPDINLLRDTRRPDDPASKKPAPKPGELPLTDPEPTPKGLAGMFKSLLSRQPKAIPPANGSMSLGKTAGSDQRILSETRKAGPAVIPLPDDDGEFSVNLLTEDLANRFDPRQKLLQLGAVALGSAGLVAAAWFGLSVYENSIRSEVTATQTEITAVQANITRLAKEQQTIAATTAKTAAISSLIADHIHWTKFFAKLEHYTLPSVTYGSTFSGNTQGSVTFAGQTTTFEDVAKQYLILEQAVQNHDFISDFTITGATRTTTKAGQIVNFSVAMNLLPGVFRDAEPAAASVTTIAP